MDPQKVFLDSATGPMIALKALGYEEGWLDMKNPSFGENFVAHPLFL